MTFKMWSIFHLIFILSPFIVTILLIVTTANLDDRQTRIVGIILSVICIIILGLRNLEIYLKDKSFNPEIFPLQICHFANFVLLFAFLKDDKAMFATAFGFNLPAAMMSILFANSLENYATILNFRGIAYIIGHLLIVAITLWALVKGFIKFSTREIFKGLMFIFSLFILGLIINNLFNNVLTPNYSANYFYTIKPEGGTPLEAMYNLGKLTHFGWFEINIIYIILLLTLGSIIYLSISFLVKSINNKKIKPKLKITQT